MESREEILATEKILIDQGVETFPIHTELLLDIRDLLIKINSNLLKQHKGAGSKKISKRYASLPNSSSKKEVKSK